MREYRPPARYSHRPGIASIGGSLCDNRPVLQLEAFEGNPDFVLSLARGTGRHRSLSGPARRRYGGRHCRAHRVVAGGRAPVADHLELLGYAGHSGPVYRLSSRALRLGFSFLSSSSLSVLALPILEEISAVIHESSSISMLEGDEIVYLARSATQRVMSVGLSVGSRLPAYCTSMGRVMLAGIPPEDLTAYLRRVELKKRTPKSITRKRDFAAELERVRQQGYALVDEELELGLRSLAVPVRSRSGKLVAAINTGVQAARTTPREMVERFLPVLREGAGRLSLALP